MKQARLIVVNKDYIGDTAIDNVIGYAIDSLERCESSDIAQYLVSNATSLKECIDIIKYFAGKYVMMICDEKDINYTSLSRDWIIKIEKNNKNGYRFSWEKRKNTFCQSSPISTNLTTG